VAVGTGATGRVSTGFGAESSSVSVSGARPRFDLGCGEELAASGGRRDANLDRRDAHTRAQAAVASCSRTLPQP
jgi:hypothetical protein